MNEQLLQNIIEDSLYVLVDWHIDIDELGLEPEDLPIARIVGCDDAAHAIVAKARALLIGELEAIERHIDVTPESSKWRMWNYGYRDCLDALLHGMPLDELIALQEEG